MFQRILVALDRSSISRPVFDEALILAKATHATLMLLHVLSPLDAGYPGPIYPVVDSVHPTLYDEVLKSYSQQLEQFQQEGLAFLRSLSSEAAAVNVTVEFSQNLGDAGRVICEIASSWDADLILMGRRGRSGLTEMFLGSVSNYVLHHAPCSVLAVQGAVCQKTTANSDRRVATVG